MQHEDEDRIGDVKRMLAESIEAETSVSADAFQLENDVYVAGSLSEIMEWSHNYRSEIEELGL